MKISEISYGDVERPDAVSVIGGTEVRMQIEK
jgi:hypothetical protein